MGRITVSEFVSVDGVMEAPGGEPGYRHTGWVERFPVGAMVNYNQAVTLAHEALLVGRTTYESLAEGWPGRTGEFADKMNGMRKYVVSTTLKRADWNNSTVLQGDVAAAVAKLKQELHGDLLVIGSHTLANTLKQHDLVDEYRLMVYPIVLGSGMRLFDTADDVTTLALVETKWLEAGIVVLTYRPARSGAHG